MSQENTGARGAPPHTDIDQVNDQRTDQRNTNRNNQKNLCEAEQRTRVEAEQAVQMYHSAPVQQTDLRQVHITVNNVLPGAGGVPAAVNLTGSLAGQVNRRRDGSALAGALVEVFFGPLFGVPVRICRTDTGGSFSVDDLPAGFYAARVHPPDLQAVADLCNLRVLPGQVAWHQFTLDEGYSGAPVRIPRPAGVPRRRVRQRP